jgi:hypothetical protein
MLKHLLFAAASFFLANSLSAQWNTDTLVRNAICSATGYQYKPAMCSDGRKGAIIVWDDQRVSPQRLFVQRIDSAGKTKWATDGIQLSIPSGTFSPDNPIIISDSNNGALIVYEVTVIGGADNIYIQHINGAGTELWNAGAGGLGVAVAQDSRINNHDVSNNQNVSSDGNGGAFITWQAYNPFNIFVQHVDKNATLIWGSGGIQVTSSDSLQTGYNSFVVNSGKNTAEIGYSYGTRFYLKRIQSNGALAWDSAALLTSTLSSFAQAYLAFDNASTKRNVFAVWQDTRNSGTTGIDLYMQRVDTSGAKLLDSAGVLLAGDPGDEAYPYVLVDANGATYTTYITGFQAKLQHTQSRGTNLWNGTSGVAVTTNGGGNTYPVITDNGTGGVITLWHDSRNSTESLYAQNFDADGNALWRVNGVPVIVGSVDQNHSTNPIVSFSGDTAITAFDKANGGITGNDIYAARFGGTTGILPLKLLSFTAELNNDKVIINWSTANELNIARFEVQRSADAINYLPVSSVNSKGGGSVNNYVVTDASPFTGVNYYRLKEVDVDGYANYSQVVSVVRTAGMSLVLYPNPAHDQIYLNITSTQPRSDIFGVYSSAGNLILQKTVQINNGTTVVKFDIDNLAKGVYFIRNGNSSEKLRFVKN